MTPAEMGAHDGATLRATWKVSRALGCVGLPLAAARACLEAHMGRIEAGESSPDDAPEYGAAFLRAALGEES